MFSELIFIQIVGKDTFFLEFITVHGNRTKITYPQ